MCKHFLIKSVCKPFLITNILFKYLLGIVFNHALLEINSGQISFPNPLYTLFPIHGILEGSIIYTWEQERIE